MFEPITFEDFKAIWPRLSKAQKEAYAVDGGPVRRVINATNNQEVLGSNYSLTTNQTNVRSVYVWGPDDLPEFILGSANEVEWQRVENINPLHTAQVLGYGMQIEPRIIDALKAVNEGLMPAILNPVVPNH
ncbi:hypothetical protein [Spirosoma sp.]|uniref:hypothetical protein n=1 Tax=Spirosoma sp. TaxID=1899569 RepID=UPI0026214CC6|nr:hypothetical protein [Spirosoma sp.]MCX6217621.1 hypothetical protein [Spirosoma sp.]